ncbi:MAG: glycyl-radical enzyme activating protein [Dehalococcoidales bacterium]|nr:glycyl-radical enzyme activating protein [Dehalococcoidales bacterium]
MLTGRLFNIMKYSVRDGTGIRITVFFKGCPLRCAWCHNPESQALFDEIMFTPELCLNCGQCSRLCPRALITRRHPTGAPALNAAVPYRRAECQHCGRCAAACPSGAREIAGRQATVEEVLREIENDTVFFDQSGGGVTFSGGEPLLQSGFLLDLLHGCRALELHTAVDTSGYAPFSVIEEVAPLVDLLLYDLKVMDGDRHRHWTGVSNDLILSNLRWLAANHHRVVIRVPVIPGVNDDEENMEEMGRFLVEVRLAAAAAAKAKATLLHPDHLSVVLLPYHKAGVEKYRRLDRRYDLGDLEPATPEALEGIAAKLRQLDLSAGVG